MKCKVCGKMFKLLKENRYTATENITEGIFASLQNRTITTYECFDCPNCGCQNQVNKRFPMMGCEKVSECN